MPEHQRRIGRSDVAALFAFSYFLIAGGTPVGELLPFLRVATALLASAVVAYYALTVRRDWDAVDVWLIAAVVVFAGAGALSEYPRQSFDAVLSALGYAAAAFIARRMLASPPMRRAFVRTLVILSAIVTLSTAARWLPVVQTWWSVTGAVVPALDLDYPAMPWGHWHDLALLVCLLYPAWWVGKPGILRQCLAIVIGALAALIVFVDGSRNLWLAFGIATLGIVAPRIVRRLGGLRRVSIATAALIVALTAVAVPSGVGQAFIERVGNAANLGFRAAMWEPLTAAWVSHPVAGFGPGSFPWILQRTGYFDTNSYAPRHPDSAIFQLLPEAGLLGIVAVGIILWALVPRLARGRSTAARWALMAFAVACLAANPSDFGFLVIVAIGWFALAVPHERKLQPVAGERRGRSIVRSATAASLVVVAVAFGATTAGIVFYAQARQDIAAGRPEAARGNLDAAVAFDPGLALYRRQRGALSLTTGDPAGAIEDLAAATRINPSDDLAWRSLALAQMSAGPQEAAGASLRFAVDAHRSNPANLLLLASWSTSAGDSDAAKTLLAEAVQAWPMIVGAPGWASVLARGVPTSEAIDQALAKWLADHPSPEPRMAQGLLLVALADRENLLAQAIGVSGLSPALGRATFDAGTCRDGDDVLRTLSAADQRTLQYWQLRVRFAALDGRTDDAAERLTAAWGADPRGGDGVSGMMNPLNENGASGFSTDAWGYRREPIVWEAGSVQLPSVSAGTDRWLLDPRGWARDAGLTSRLSDCQ